MDSSNLAQPFIRQVGRAVAILRTRNGWTQEVLASRMAVSQKAIAKFEAGNHDFRLSTVWRFAVALAVSPADLLATVADPDASTTARPRGPLHGLAQAGWRRVPAETADAIPVFDVQPRAGTGRARPEPLAVAWALPPTGRHPTETGMFLAQIRGDSMTPHLSDGDWCLFSKQFADIDWLGKLVLVRETDASGLSSWVVKKATGISLDAREARVLNLASSNPAYPLRQVHLDSRGDLAIEAVVREVLGGGLQRSRT